MANGAKKGADKAKKENFFKRAWKAICGFFKGIKNELKKVTWPTKKELFRSTLSVLIVCVVIGLIIFGVDSLLQFLTGLIKR